MLELIERLREFFASSRGDAITFRPRSHCRRLLCEPLENRRLLSVAITGVTSTYGNFRFLSGENIPAVSNTYTAQVTGGTPAKVEFDLGGQSVTDSNPNDGWSATFNMSSLTTATDLIVKAYVGSTVADTRDQPVSIAMLPSWMKQSNVVYSATFDQSSGYAFSVYDKDLDYGFNTPSTWQWNPLPQYLSSPIVNLGGLRTGFDTGWTFTMVSSPSGIVSASDTGYRIHAQVLNVDVWNHIITPGTSDDFDLGPAKGTYSISFNPAFNNDLTFSGVSGTATLGLELDLSQTIFEAQVSLVGLPFVASLASLNVGVDADLSVSFDASATVTLSNGGLALSSASMHPNVTAGLSAFAEGSIGNLGPWSLAKAGIKASGTLSQDFIATYSNNTWSYDAPGSLNLSGNLYWDTVFHLWQGGVDLFNWNVASWDFATHNGSSSQQGSLPAPKDAGPPVNTTPVQGSDFSLDTAAWDDHSGYHGNTVNGVIEAGEHPYLRIKLASDKAVTDVNATLQSQDSAIQVLDREVYFDDFPSATSQWAVNPFLVALNFSDHRTSNFVLHVTYKIGTQLYYQDLQPFPATFYRLGELSPSFAVTNCSIDDSASISGAVDNNGDGLVESGETVYLRPTILNQGTARATHVSAYITTDNTNVTTPSGNTKQFADLYPGIARHPSHCLTSQTISYFVWPRVTRGRFSSTCTSCTRRTASRRWSSRVLSR